MNCNNELAQAEVTYVAVPGTSAAAAAPSVSLSASAPNQATGQSITLTWTSAHADSCAASGGNAGDAWGGSLPLTGSKSLTEAGAGAVTYSITCTGSPPAATASTTVVFAIASGGTSGSGSSGGGGDLDPQSLIGLVLLVSLRARPGSRSPRRNAQ